MPCQCHACPWPCLFSLFSRSPMRRQREAADPRPKTTRRSNGGARCLWWWWSGRIEVFFFSPTVTRKQGRVARSGEVIRRETKLPRGGLGAGSLGAWRDGSSRSRAAPGAGWDGMEWWWVGGSRCRGGAEQPLGKGHSSPVQLNRVVLAGSGGSLPSSAERRAGY
jgi:hypothetical protein